MGSGTRVTVPKVAAATVPKVAAAAAAAAATGLVVAAADTCMRILLTLPERLKALPLLGTEATQ